MPDVLSLLEGATPDDVVPLDVDRLVRRSRRRRARRRALAASTAVVTAIALGAAAITALGSGAGAPDVALSAVGPDGTPLTEPVGSWSRADDPPFSARTGAFGGTLSDGRVVVWGGHDDDADDAGDTVEGGPVGFADGGVLDPVTGEWAPIPPAPVPEPTTGGAFVTSAQLFDDRLAVVTGSSDGGLHAAVYDVAAGAWIDAPEQTDIVLAYDAMAWDGETLALVRTRPGESGTVGGVDHQLDWRVDAPLTLRWRPGDDHWTPGAPSPLGLRDHVGAAFDGSQLALWGGSAGGATLNDGAIYAVASDTWTAIPEGPLPGRVHAATVWDDGRLIVGGGLDRLVDPGEYLGDVAAYDPATHAWETLPPPPEGGLHDPRSTWSFAEAATVPVMADSTSGSGEPEPRWFLRADGWEQAPLGGIVDLAGFVAATLGDAANFGSIPYELRVRVGPGEWLDAVEAPFDSRYGATTVPTPDGHLVVVGGLEGADLDLSGDAWIFDLSA